MGGTTRQFGGTKLKRLVLLIIIIICFFPMPNDVVSAINDEYRNQYADLLKKGNNDEKKLALNKTWFFLKFKDYGKDFNLLEPLLNALKDKNPSIRETAAASLRNIEGMETRKRLFPFLIDALNDKNPGVRREAVVTLSIYKDSRTLEPLLKILQDEDPWVRLSAAFALGELRYQESFNPLLDALKIDDPDWRNKYFQQECIIALRKLELPSEVDKNNLKTVLRNKFNDPYLKGGVIKTLGHFRFDESNDLLILAAGDSSELIRKLSIEAMASMPSFGLPIKNNETSVDDPRIDICLKALADQSVAVKLQAIAAVSLLKDNRPVDSLINALKDKNGEVRRNAMIALANFADEKILDVLIEYFGKEQYNYQDAVISFLSVAEKTCQKRLYVYKKDGVRGIAANEWSFPKNSHGRQLMVHPLAVGKLLNAFDKREDTDKGILSALSCFEDERIFPLVMKYFDKRQGWFKQEAIKIASYTDSDNAFPLLIKAVKDQDKNVRKEAVLVLGQIRDKRSVQPLLDVLNDKDDDLRASAINALMNYDDPRVLDLCYPLLKDKSSDVRYAAALYITNKPDKKSVEHLINILEDPKSGGLALIAADALSVIKDDRAIEPLIKALKRPPESNRIDGFESGLRNHAATALGKIGNTKAVPALIECLSNEKNDKFLRKNAAKALKHIGDPIALKAIAAVPEDWLREIGSAKKVSVPPAPPKRKLPANIPGYPILD